MIYMMKNKKILQNDTISKIMWIVLIINTFLLLPCFFSTIRYCMMKIFTIDIFDTFIQYILYLLILPTLSFCIVQCFFLPEILFIASIILEIINLIISIKNKQIKKRNIFICILLDMICFIAFFSVSSVFDNMMSV